MYENYDGAPTSISRLTLTKSCICACNRTVRTPHTLGKNNQQKAKSLPKAIKTLLINTLSKGIWKGKIKQQKQDSPKLQTHFKSILFKRNRRRFVSPKYTYLYVEL